MFVSRNPELFIAVTFIALATAFALVDPVTRLSATHPSPVAARGEIFPAQLAPHPLPAGAIIR